MSTPGEALSVLFSILKTPDIVLKMFAVMDI